MRLYEVTNTITLDQLYDGDLPAHNELFWELVTQKDLNIPLPIYTLTYSEIWNMFQKQYQITKISDLKKLLNPEQKQIIKNYQKYTDPTSIIVVYIQTIIDGNHRALAALLNKKSIQCVRLENLPE